LPNCWSLIQATRLPAIASSEALTECAALPYAPRTTEVAPGSTFQTWIRPPLDYLTRGPSIASVQTGAAVPFTLLACGLAAPACEEENSRAGASNSPAIRSLLLVRNLASGC
jgi:hypothetical protein